MSRQIYEEQVELMLRVLPIVAKSEYFALKGGTAINFFVQDMPRLSVDIDLTYIPIDDRSEALNNINNELIKICNDIKSTFNELTTDISKSNDGSIIKRIFISNDITRIKVDPNFILRGTVEPCTTRPLSINAQNKFSLFSEISTLSDAELYAGKICAAHDRQHPRDLFDIKILYENGGLTDAMRKAFIIYLASATRPLHELLNPNLLDINALYQNEFSGMTTIPVSLDELIDTRKQLITDIRSGLTDDDKSFILSLKSGMPNWELHPAKHVMNLPAIRWKLMNIQKMSVKKKELMRRKLIEVLEM